MSCAKHHACMCIEDSLVDLQDALSSMTKVARAVLHTTVKRGCKVWKDACVDLNTAENVLRRARKI